MRNRPVRRAGVLAAIYVSGLVAPLTASATPGDLVTPFGGDGRASVDAGAAVEPATVADMVAMPDGRTVVLLERVVGSTLTRTIVRLAADGSPDTTWNGGGAVTPPQEADFGGDTVRLAVDATGRVLFGTQEFVTRYTVDGALDTGFSGDGIVDTRALVSTAEDVRDLQVLADGRVEVLLDRQPASGNKQPSLLRLTAAGTGDPTFSTDGRFDIPTSAAEQIGRDLERDASGNVYASIESGLGPTIAKVSSTGALVAAYAGDGIAESGSPEISVDDSGRAMTYYTDSSSIYVGRLTSAGAPDETWGPGGTRDVSFAQPFLTIHDSLLAGGTAYLAVDCTCGPAIAAVDLATGAPAAGFDPGDPDGEGLLVVGGPNSQAMALDLGPGGPIRLAWSSQQRDPAEVVQVTTAGVIDPTYAGDGRATAGLRRHRVGKATDVAVASAGDLAVAGVLDDGRSGAFVGRLTSSGARDLTFGDGGTVVVPVTPLFGSDEFVEPRDVEVLPDGRVAVLVTRHPEFSTDPTSTLLVLDESGAPDLGFSDDGALEVGVTASGAQGTATALALGGTGGGLHLFVGGIGADGANFFVRKVGLDGVVDAAYGAADGTANGWSGVNASLDLYASDRELQIAGAPDGSLLWGGLHDTMSGPNDGFTIGRLTPTGVADGTFGAGGSRSIVLGYAGDYDLPLALVRRPDGGADLVARWAVNDALTMRVTGTGALDASYAGDGVSQLDLPSFPDVNLPMAATSQDGRTIFSYGIDATTNTQLFRVSTSGTPDTSFGTAGARSTAHVPRSSIRRPTLLIPGGDAVFVDDAVTAAGPGEAEGRDAELVKISTEPSVPGPPTGATAVAGDGMATVSWTAPASNGGAAITGYTVTASPGGATCGAPAGVTACALTGLTNGTPYTFTVKATNSIGSSITSAATASVTPGAGKGAFVPLPSPKRIVDSRSSTGDTDDEQEERFGALATGATRAIPVAGRVGLTSTVENVVLSVVAVGPTGAGYLTIYPCGTPRPTTSNLNFTTGVTLANTVITKLGTGGTHQGKVCVYAGKTTNLIIDVTGSLTSTAFDALPSPKRITDSRATGDTDDDQEKGFGALTTGSTRAIPVAGRVGLDADTENVVLSVVAVGPTGAGYLTIYPCGTPRPTTSNLNFTTGVTLANTVITKLGTGGTNQGKVCVYAGKTTNLIIDVTGSLS